MINILVTKELAKPLGLHLRPRNNSDNQPDLVWRSYFAQIGAELCVVMQEQHSQYVMVFCGLSNGDFRDFPNIFGKRFLRETVAICRQAQTHEVSVLADYIGKLCDEQCYQLDPEPLEESKLTKVMEKLERLFLYERQPLPVEGQAAFEFGYRINSQASKSSSEQLAPIEVFQGICLNLVDIELEKDRKANDPVLSVTDNLVHVDFSRGRNRV